MLSVNFEGEHLLQICKRLVLIKKGDASGALPLKSVPEKDFCTVPIIFPSNMRDWLSM